MYSHGRGGMKGSVYWASGIGMWGSIGTSILMGFSAPLTEIGSPLSVNKDKLTEPEYGDRPLDFSVWLLGLKTDTEA